MKIYEPGPDGGMYEVEEGRYILLVDHLAALHEQREKYQSLIQLCQELDNLADGLKMPRVLWPILNGIRANLEIIRAFAPGKEDGEDERPLRSHEFPPGEDPYTY